MSLKYEILKKLIKRINIKKKFDKSAEEIIAKKKRRNARVKIASIQDKDFIIAKTDVMGFPVIQMTHKEKTSKACLFIIGTGMVGAFGPGAVKKALKIAKQTGMDMVVPYYPLCTDYPLTKAYAMIHETYKEMLRSHAANDVTVFGTSSGGNLALGLVAYINDGHDDVPMPGRIIAISPGTCVNDEEEWQRMLELDKKDLVIPASYMKTAVDIMRHGDHSVPEYMIWLQRGNFTNCPKVTFIYGSDETLYACAPTFEKVMKKYNVEYKMIVGEGMYHCYPVFPIVKEAKDGWKMMIDIMKEQGQ